MIRLSDSSVVELDIDCAASVNERETFNQTLTGSQESGNVSGMETGRTTVSPSEWQQDLQAWAADAKRRRPAARSVDQDVIRAEHLMRFAAERMGEDTPRRWRNITREMAGEWLEHIAENGIPRRGHLPKPVSPSTLRNYISAMRAMFNHMIRMEIAVHNPFESMSSPRRESGDQRAFLPAEVAALIEVAEADERAVKPRCRNREGPAVQRSELYRFLWHTGMRKGAACKLRWLHITLHTDPAMVIVPAELNRKGAGGYEIALEDAYRTQLAAYKGKQNADRRDLVFDDVRYEVLQSDAKAAGLETIDERDRRIGFHCFRRGLATGLLAEGMDPKRVQKRMGHADVTTTLRHYVDTEKLDARAAAALAAKMLQESCNCPVDVGDDSRHDVVREPQVDVPRRVAREPHRQRRGERDSGDSDNHDTGSSPVSPIVAGGSTREILRATASLLQALADSL